MNYDYTIHQSCTACGSSKYKNLVTLNLNNRRKFEELCMAKYDGYLSEMLLSVSPEIVQCLECHH